MTLHQPLPPQAAAEPAPLPGAPDSQLLELWVQLTVRYAQSADHGRPEQSTLLRSLLDAERQIRQEHPSWFALWADALLAWQSSGHLLHPPSGDASRCAHCLRAVLQLPGDLPVPAQRLAGER